MKAAMCIYCGMNIPHSDNPENIKEIHQTLMAHDRICEHNPTNAENKALKEAVVLAFSEGFASDSKDVNEAFKHSLTKKFLDKLRELTK
jgi:hypothetical protein